MKSLPDIKYDTKDLIAQNKLGQAISYLKDCLILHSEKYDELILLSARHKRLLEYQHKNIISYQNLEIEISKIENALMYITNALDTKDLIA